MAKQGVWRINYLKTKRKPLSAFGDIYFFGLRAAVVFTVAVFLCPYTVLANAQALTFDLNAVSDSGAIKFVDSGKDTSKPCGCSKTSAITPDTVHLVLLHTTDLHGRILEPTGGFARIADYVRQIRSSESNVLVLDAGDAWQGNALMSMSEGSTMVKAMNVIGYDAMALGNHEFDFGQRALVKNLATTRFPILAANVSAGSKGGYEITRGLRRSVVKNIGGVRVGIVGLTPQTLRYMMPEDRYAGLNITGEREAVERELKKLSGQVDVVVVLAHVPWDRLQSLVENVSDVDIAIGGHTHEEAAGFEAGNALVAQAGKHAEVLGRIDVWLGRDKVGQLHPRRKIGRLIRVMETMVADSQVMGAVGTDMALAEKILAEEVAEAKGSIYSGSSERPEESDLVDLTLEAMLSATGAEIVLSSGWTEKESGFDTGPITMDEIYEAYPYDDRLYVAELPGAALKGILEKSTEWYLSKDAWRSVFAGGISYEIHVGSPSGARVRNIRLGDAVLADTALYRVAMDGYVAAGGVYPAARESRSMLDVQKGLRGSVVQHLKSKGTVGSNGHGRWSRVIYPTEDTKRIDVNRAEMRDLLTVPGMTEEMALSIVSFRQERQALQNLSDLLKIPGMTSGAYLSMRDYFTVGRSE